MRVKELRGDGYHPMRGGIQETGLCHREGTGRGQAGGRCEESYHIAPVPALRRATTRDVNVLLTVELFETRLPGLHGTLKIFS